MREVVLADLRSTPPTYVRALVSRDANAIRDRLTDIERLWSPVRRSVDGEYAAVGEQLDHAHWDWTMLVRASHQLVSIDCDGECQGLMAIESTAKPSRIEPTERVVYVDLIESAPWNLKSPQRRPKYGGVGLYLIAEAVRISIEWGYRGRIGLHALGQAESFYRDTTAHRCGMTDLGPNEVYNYQLRYFEFTAERAVEFLEEKGLEP